MLAVLALVTSVLGLAASPAGAEPALVVDPSTDLVDRQSVSLSATGFSPGLTFGAAQCDLETAQASQTIDGCDLSTSVLTTTDAAGEVSTTMLVRRFIQVQGETVDCAVPDTCIIGAATLSSDLITPLETAFAPIVFDPDAPVLPPLEIDVVVDEVTVDGATGTVTCNREAQAFVDASLFQEKANAFIDRFGFIGPVPCDVTPSPFNVAFEFGFGRVTAGDVFFDVFASAFDGVDDAFDFESGQTRVTGQSGIVGSDRNIPGNDIEITAIDTSSTSGASELVLTVECARPLVVSVDGFVTQVAGLRGVAAGAFVEDVMCDGETVIVLPLQPQGGVVVGGPAFASASVFFFDPTTFEFDFAERAERVVLSGRTRPGSIEPNPASRITIDSASRDEVRGTIDCEAPVTVEVLAGITQEQGRSTRGGFGFGLLEECDGETPFVVAIDGDDLRRGDATVGVSAFGYTVDPGPPPMFMFEWDDFQVTSLRL